MTNLEMMQKLKQKQQYIFKLIDMTENLVRQSEQGNNLSDSSLRQRAIHLIENELNL